MKCIKRIVHHGSNRADKDSRKNLNDFTAESLSSNFYCLLDVEM